MVAVWAVPGARRPGIAGLHDGALRVRVSAPAVAGRANRELVRLLAAVVGAPVELLSGTTGRRKRLLVQSLAPAEVASRFRA